MPGDNSVISKNMLASTISQSSLETGKCLKARSPRGTKEDAANASEEESYTHWKLKNKIFQKEEEDWRTDR